MINALIQAKYGLERFAAIIKLFKKYMLIKAIIMNGMIKQVYFFWLKIKYEHSKINQIVLML